MIILGQRGTDYINQMITIANESDKSKYGLIHLVQLDHTNKMIPLSIK